MLSKRAKELVDLLTGRKIGPVVGKAQKLIIGDGPARLEADTISFVKSMLQPRSVPAALAARGR
jgi:hypothetical protein